MTRKRAVVLLSVVLCMTVILSACTIRKTEDIKTAETDNIEQENPSTIEKGQESSAANEEAAEETRKQTIEETAGEITEGAAEERAEEPAEEPAKKETMADKETQEAGEPTRISKQQSPSQKNATRQNTTQQNSTQQNNNQKNGNMNTSQVTNTRNQTPNTTDEYAEKIINEINNIVNNAVNEKPSYSQRYTPRDDIAQQVFAEMNRIRQEVGARALVWDKSAAQKMLTYIKEESKPVYSNIIVTVTLDSAKDLKSQVMNLMKQYSVSVADSVTMKKLGTAYPLIYSTQVTRVGVVAVQKEILETINGKTEVEDKEIIVAAMFIEEEGKGTYDGYLQLISSTILNTINSTLPLKQNQELNSLAMEYCKAAAAGKSMESVDRSKYTGVFSLGGTIHTCPLEYDVLQDFQKANTAQYFKNATAKLLNDKKDESPSIYGIAIYPSEKQRKVYVSLVVGKTADEVYSLPPFPEFEGFK